MHLTEVLALIIPLVGSSYGPLVNAGIRAALRGKIYTLRLSYKIGLEKAQFKTFGAGIYIGF